MHCAGYKTIKKEPRQALGNACRGGGEDGTLVLSDYQFSYGGGGGEADEVDAGGEGADVEGGLAVFHFPLSALAAGGIEQGQCGGLVGLDSHISAGGVGIDVDTLIR